MKSWISKLNVKLIFDKILTQSEVGSEFLLKIFEKWILPILAMSALLGSCIFPAQIYTFEIEVLDFQIECQTTL